MDSISRVHHFLGSNLPFVFLGRIPAIVLEVDPKQIERCVLHADRHLRVKRTVDLFAERLVDAHREEESRVDFWVVVIPDRVKKYCRPKSTVDADIRISTPVSAKDKKSGQMHLFREEANEALDAAQYEVNFHHQIKARLLESQIPTQIVLEGTLALMDAKPETDLGSAIRQSEIAWNLSTAAFYKSGGRPWKVADVRPGVCYLGLVFKREDRSGNPRMAACGAQMFLDSGDGAVFKGNLGPWYAPKYGDFHLDAQLARELVEKARRAYRAKFAGQEPRELFIHGRVTFGDKEWGGFQSALSSSTRLVGVKIRHDGDLKLYRLGRNPVLRGLFYRLDRRNALLWTKGWIPRLQTYPGRGVPNPLRVEICRGEADLETVVRDIQALTKLNYNTCIHGDGLPITLKFSNAVGEILTAAPIKGEPPLPFWHYI